MGMLVDGRWQADEDRFMVNGAFRRERSILTSVTAQDLSRALTRPVSPVLVASLSCPWSHRTLLVRALKGLDRIPVVHAGGPRTEGYRLPKHEFMTCNGASPRHLHQLYSATAPHFTGRATVPLIWDREQETILGNQSSVIARAFDTLDPAWRLAPEHRQGDIDRLNGRITRGLSDAVYQAGLATRQDAYDTAVRDVFGTLDWLETRLAKSRCLFGSLITESDLFLFATLVRFDLVYVSHFRCTRRRLVDYPALWAYARDIHSWPGIAATVDTVAIRQGYYLYDGETNPHGILPELPDVDWNRPHGRDALGPLRIWTPAGIKPIKDAATLRHDR